MRCININTFLEKEVLISIIVPVYNVSDYLLECIKSISAQTIKNIEIICVNDGSTDDSLEILKNCQQYDKRIKIISQKNQGLSAARNAGLDIAKGKYIGFVDSDDYISPDMYLTLYNSIVNYDTDIAICNFYSVIDNDLYINTNCNDYLIYNNIQYIKEILMDNNIKNYVWSRLYKKELFDDIRFPVGKNFEDVVISTYMLDKINKVYFVGKPLYYYRYRNNSITSSLIFYDIQCAINNCFERYLYIKKHYHQLMDINVFSMLKWIIIRKEEYDLLKIDNFFESFDEILYEVICDYDSTYIDNFSDEYYPKIKSFIEEYREYLSNKK